MNGTWTKKQRIAYHNRLGQRIRNIQYSKIKELKSFGFHVTAKGDIYDMTTETHRRGKLVTIPEYKWHRLKLWKWKKDFKITTNRPLNVFKDWELKLYFPRKDNPNDYTGRYLFFSCTIDFITYCTEIKLDGMPKQSLLDSFYESKDLCLLSGEKDG